MNNTKNNNCSNKMTPNKQPTGPTRPRPPALWSSRDVVLWLERHCGDLGTQYSNLFYEHNVTGRSLLRINSGALERMGIVDSDHRDKIHREIMKLKLRADILELRDLEKQLTTSSSYLNVL